VALGSSYISFLLNLKIIIKMSLFSCPAVRGYGADRSCTSQCYGNWRGREKEKEEVKGSGKDDSISEGNRGNGCCGSVSVCLAL